MLHFRNVVINNCGYAMFFVLQVLMCISCTSNKSNQEEGNEFSWGKPVLIDKRTSSALQTAHTIAPDGKTLSILFDTTMRFHFSKNDVVDTTYSYLLEVPVKNSEKFNFLIANDLRYFLSKDSLTYFNILLEVSDKIFDIGLPLFSISSDTLYSFSYMLSKENLTSQKYIIKLIISKPKSTSDLLIQFDSLDIVAVRKEDNYL